MDVNELVCGLEQRTTDRFQSQICSIQNFNVRISLKQVDRQLVECGIDETDALVRQLVSVGRVSKLRFIVSHHVLEKTRKLFAALIWDVAYAANIEIAAPQVDRRGSCAKSRHEDSK